MKRKITLWSFLFLFHLISYGQVPYILNLSDSTQNTVPNDLIQYKEGTFLTITLHPGNYNINLVGSETRAIDLICSYTGNLYCVDNSVSYIRLGKNIIQSGNLNTQSINLIDGCLFDDINNVHEIYYDRTPLSWTTKNGNIGKGDGWETICLTFDAILTVNNVAKYPALNPEKNVSYWLRSFVGIQGDAAIFTNAPSIKKNTPYIIALPGKDYGNLSLEDAGIVRFEGTGKVLSNKGINNNPSSPFIPNFGKGNISGYVLNSNGEFTTLQNLSTNGTSFHRMENVSLSPSRAYFTSDLFQGTQLRIAFSNAPTDLGETIKPEEMNVYVQNGNIHVEGKSKASVSVVNALTGMVLTTVIPELSPVIDNLPKGVYLIGHKKVIL